MPFDQVTRSIVKTFTYIVCHKRFCCYIENDIHKNVENELDLSMTKGVWGGGEKEKRHQFPESCPYIINYDVIDVWTEPSATALF